MDEATKEDASERLHPSRIRRWGLITALLMVGLVSLAYPTFISGFDAIQTDPGDPRFNNYILEHGYRWLRGTPGHQHFWDPPIFYPAPNVAAFSDILLGAAPLYWGYRAAGFPPDTSLQLWTLSVVILNFLAAYLLFIHGLGLNTFAGAGGAYYFAFAGIRIANQGHHQLLPQFFAVIALYFLVCLFRNRREEGQKNRSLWFLFFACIVLQLYAGFYLGWFLLLGLGVCFLVCCAMVPGRQRVFQVVRQDWPQIMLSMLLAVAALYWMYWHYLQGLSGIGSRLSWQNVSEMVPRLQSWLNHGAPHLFYGWMESHLGFSSSLPINEHRIGPGLISLSFAMLGFYWGRRSLGMKILALSSLVIFLLALSYPGGWSPWKCVFHVVPGAGAIRAISRIAILLLIPLSVGIALFLHSIKNKRIAFLLLLLVGVEQLQRIPSYNKQQTRARVERIAQMIPRDCRAFFYAPEKRKARLYKDYILQLDAMWAQIATGIPTVNGYSGYNPQHWEPLRENHISNARDVARIRGALLEWRRVNNVAARDICVVGYDGI